MSKPFETEEFFAGALHAINYMIQVAQDTQGAAVWTQLFVQMKKGLIQDAEKKGFILK